MAVEPIPPGYYSITPYLIIRGAARAIDFYKEAFGATEVMRLQTPQGTIAHAEIKIGNSHVMLADEFPQMDVVGPETLNGTSVSLLLYCSNVDDLFAQALKAGAVVLKPLQNQFYGDRSGTVKDPFGHHWSLATHIEDVSPEELNRRCEEMMKTME